MTDLTRAIEANLDASRKARRQRFRSKVVNPELTTPESFPRLDKPKRGAPSATKEYPYTCGQMDWTKRDWWRFKRACYAQGFQARDVIRTLCAQYTEDYEATDGAA